MSASSDDQDFAPLPNKLRLNQPVDAPTKKQSSHARIRVDALPLVEPKPAPPKEVEKVEEKPKKDKAKEKKADKSRKDESKARFDELGEIPAGTGESWFSGATKWFIIFLICMFGSMLFVWYIGGPEEVTVDHLDAQYAALGLDSSATDSEVKTMFKKLARKYHPDKCKEPECEGKFVVIEKAKETILKWGTYFRARRVVSPHNSM